MEDYDRDSDNDLLSDVQEVNEQELFGEDGNEIEDTNGNEDRDMAMEDNTFEDKPPKPVKSKRIVKNPQPKLNFEALQGPKGLTALSKQFENFKFRGDKHVKEDMSEVLMLLEQWSYRLFPKFHFEDSLQRLESLGKKKVVQVYLKKIRLGLLDNDDVVRQLDDDEEPDVGLQDPFDEILSQQIERQDRPDPFDEIMSQEIGRRSQHDPSADVLPRPNEKQTQSVSLTEEQIARIKANRKLAEERRRKNAVQAMETDLVINNGKGDELDT